MGYFKSFLGLAVLVLVAVGSAGSVTIAELEDLYVDDIRAIGFTLKQGAEVDIEAVGIRAPRSQYMVAYAWIINSESRELVWEMGRRGTKPVEGNRSIRKKEDVEFLEAGKYELYYSIRTPNNWYGNWGDDGTDLFDALGRLFDGVRDEDMTVNKDVFDKCYVRLTSDELGETDIARFEPDGGLPNSLIRHNRLGDSEFITTGFELSQPMNIRVYAIIEYPDFDDYPVDYAWIVDLDSRDKVWELDRWNLDRAGGGDKNQVFDGDVKLNKGRYALHVVTDDSHSYEEFNVNPPYDPINWGVTLLPGKDFDKSAFTVIEVPGRGEPLIDFTRARNNDFYEQSFRLAQETDLHIYAIGEMAYSDREFVDLGSIINATTGEVVWEMSYRNTDHAGGASKNRMFDGVVTLPAGTYTAYYITDDSHAYRRWNSSAPFDTDSYGMAVFPVNDRKPAGLSLLSEEELYADSKILARITRVGDGVRKRVRFTLEKDSKVLIYALGEGVSGEMYDYAYIIDLDSGYDIWEMNYRRTDHAGGADKNRVYSDEIMLDAGEYEVVYESDGSHSFGRWNATPPRDPLNWGVTVSMIE